MNRHSMFMAGVAALALLVAPAVFAATLSGQVTSAKEGAIEGVLVSAKKDGATITTTVVSDTTGHYAFPDGRLAPGHYALKIRAFGYDLDGPKAANVPATGNATADVKLVPAKDLAAQMTNAEWLVSAPADDLMKKNTYGCGTCHTLERVFRSTYTQDQFQKDIFPRMVGYSSQSFPNLIQVRKQVSRMAAASPLAAFFASINLSQNKTWNFPFKGLERPKGDATHVIITEYDLPRISMQPHDVVVDEQGTVWFSNFGENALAKLDAKSGKVTEYPYAPTRPGYAFGNLDLERDQEGNIWLGMMNQTGIAKFDRKTTKFDFHPIPAALLNDTTQQAMVAPMHWEVDGKIWYNDADNRTLSRFDTKTGTFEPWMNLFSERPKGEQNGAYGIYTDSKNNLFFCDFPSDKIGRVDAKTGAVSFYQIPTPDSRPRRGRMDAEDRLWFVEWRTDKVGMLDTKTGVFKEWPVPSQYSAPYDATVDKNGEIWTGNDNDDRITRIDTKTGRTIQYLMPHEINVRRVFVDDSTPRPTFWTGSNHTASIFKLEPLD